MTSGPLYLYRPPVLWAGLTPPLFLFLPPLAPLTSYPCVFSHSPEYIQFLSQLLAPLMFARSLAGLPPSCL